MVRYEQFGAHDDGGRIRFDLYVPGPDEYRADLGGPAHIAAIEAYGTFQEPLTGQAWDLTRTVRLEPAPFEGGTLFRAVTDPVPPRFYEYKYRVSFDASDGHPVDQRIVNDPCARYGVGELENS
jgi:hypothetical protein